MKDIKYIERDNYFNREILRFYIKNILSSLDEKTLQKIYKQIRRDLIKKIKN